MATTIRPVSYNMLNGSTEYLDEIYNGFGNPFQDYAPLSGGVGDLTDGVISTANWYVVEPPSGNGPYVGWADINPTITFNFGRVVNINTVTFYVDDANGVGHVNVPQNINMSMGGRNFNSGTLVDPPSADPTSYTFSTPGFRGDTLEVTLNRRNQWVFLSEVRFLGSTGTTPTPTRPRLSINDVTVFEGNNGTTNARFTVTLTGRAEDPVTVRYSTSNGTARAGSDFISKSGTINFRASNQTRQTRTITIPVKGDRTFEGNETFRVGLSNATNAQIRDNRGIGTIRNDDNRLSFGNSVNAMSEVFEEIKDVWSSSRNSASVPYFQDDLFGSITVDSTFI